MTRQEHSICTWLEMMKTITIYKCYVLHISDGQAWWPTYLRAHRTVDQKSFLYSFLQNTYPESLIIQEAQNGLLAGHTFGVLPRGDPAHITSLTHQQLQEAHAQH